MKDKVTAPRIGDVTAVAQDAAEAHGEYGFQKMQGGTECR